MKRWSLTSWPKNSAAGRVPYVIPVGGSSGIGVFGYIGGTAELVEQLSHARHRTVAVVLRERIARHAGGPDARREVMRGAVSRLRCRRQCRRAGEDRAREAHRQRSGDAAGIAGAAGASGSRHRSGIHRRRLRHPDRRSARSDCAAGEDGSDPARPLLHVEGDGRADRSRAPRQLSPNETVVFLHTGGMPALFTPGFADAFRATR